VKYQTLFIEHHDTEALTENVNALERDGWEFVSVQLACAFPPFAADRGLGRETTPKRIPKLVSNMLATLRREARGSEPSRPLPRPDDLRGSDEGDGPDDADG